MLGKLLLLAGAALWMAAPPGNTAKTRNIEDRLNTAMPRIPWPQADPGPSYNSSYPPGNSSYTSGNYSYPVGYNDDRIGGADQANTNGISNGNTGHPLYSGTAPTDHWHSIDHYHPIPHGHIYGSLASDFNQLRQSYSDTVTAFNNHIGDHGSLVVAVQAVRASYSQLVTDHNDLVNRLASANILQ